MQLWYSACPASALADDGKACTVQTLRGSYLFAASGFNIVAGVAQPKAIVEGIDFNGDGARCPFPQRRSA